MAISSRLWAGISAAALIVSSCSSGGSDPAPLVTIALGDPLPDLTPAELASFERGKVLFEKRFRPSEGLGPFYNATSCASCHSTPVTGGSSQLYRNFYIAVAQSSTPQFASNLRGLPSPVVPAFGSGLHASAVFTLEGGRKVIPGDENGFPVATAQRNGIPVVGVGLFEFISDTTILANADPDDLDGDGISGRNNTDAGAVGRFGVKAQSNNIELFTRAPLQNQMGITSDPFLGSGGIVSASHAALLQATSDPNRPTMDQDGIADPEISLADLGDLIAFSRFLAPPQKKPFDAAAERGEDLFEAIGCVKCHIPSLDSSRGPVGAYTDILLHDMGPALADGISFGTPQSSGIDPNHTANEFRTQPLWGVSLFAPYLHDGRAATLDEAIQLHSGEAVMIRVAYENLTQSERDDLIAFLRKL